MRDYLKEITNIFREILENENITLTNETSGDDIDEWDSLNNIYLIVEIEKHFQLKFTSRQIQEWKNVGDMITAIKEKDS